MRVIIAGAGRMGQRHAQGIAGIKEIEKITLADINAPALENASNALKNHDDAKKFNFCLVEQLPGEGEYDIGIIASTANSRIDLYKRLVDLGCKNILVEKPLGQNLKDVEAFKNAIEKFNAQAYVNLNMRLYDGFIQLKKDLTSQPQLQGFKTISINTGTIGIGANGIHYLDLLYFLLDADRAEIACAHIDESVIPSGRGINFCDFGGWCVINLFNGEKAVGLAMLSLSSSSTAFGSWEIVGPNGRIQFNEVEQKRVDSLRKQESTMPVNRYFADYMPLVEKPFPAVFLGDMTAKWILSLLKGEKILPTVAESLPVHRLMFDWLKHSLSHSEFPIT